MIHVFQLKGERDRLAEELEQLKRKLDEAYKENATLHERLAFKQLYNTQTIKNLCCMNNNTQAKIEIQH